MHRNLMRRHANASRSSTQWQRWVLLLVMRWVLLLVMLLVPVSLMSCGVRVHAVGRASVGATGDGRALVNAMQGNVNVVHSNAVQCGL